MEKVVSSFAVLDDKLTTSVSATASSPVTGQRRGESPSGASSRPCRAPATAETEPFSATVDHGRRGGVVRRRVATESRQFRGRYVVYPTVDKRRSRR